MAFIRQIEPADATGELKEFYDALAEIAGGVPNIVKVSSIKPAAIKAAQDLYQSVLYHDSGLTMVEREMVATLVSTINGCAYGVDHHGAALGELVGSASLPSRIGFSFRQAGLDERQTAILEFTDKLPGWPEKVLISQRNWIGKRYGAADKCPPIDSVLTVFFWEMPGLHSDASSLSGFGK